MTDMTQTDEEFLDYLVKQLIPDLDTSGWKSTAEDFTRCVQMIQTRNVTLQVISGLARDLELASRDVVWRAELGAQGNSVTPVQEQEDWPALKELLKSLEKLGNDEPVEDELRRILEMVTNG